MIRFIQAAMRGVKAEWSAGRDGWAPVVNAGQPLATGGRKSPSGSVVSPETIMGLSAVWACTSATAQLVASLPCHLYERTANGGKTRVDSELSDIIFGKPNTVQTGPEFWESQMLHQLMQGNAYSEQLRVGSRLVGLRPLLNCTPKWTGSAFEYHVQEDREKRVLTADQVLHLRGFGAGDGLGLSAVRYGVQSFGAALATDGTAASVFSNAMMPGGVLEVDQTLTNDQRNMLKGMLDQYTSSTKAGKTLILEAGLKWSKVTWNPEDVQLLETRRFQVEDICRWFMMPPIVIGHASEGQTMWGTGVEAVMLSWLQTGINPLLKRIEKRLWADLIPPERRRTWFFEFNREAMLQMDSRAKAEFLSRMATSGTMTANERRDKLNLDRHPDPAANDLLAQTALAPLQSLGKDTVA